MPTTSNAQKEKNVTTQKAATQSKKAGNAASKKSSTNRNWNVKGVIPETRVAVRKAAQKEGKKIGEWVNEKLMFAAQETLTSQPKLPARTIEDTLAELSKNFGVIAEKVNQIETNQKKPLLKRVFGL